MVLSGTCSAPFFVPMLQRWCEVCIFALYPRFIMQRETEQCLPTQCMARKSSPRTATGQSARVATTRQSAQSKPLLKVLPLDVLSGERWLDYALLALIAVVLYGQTLGFAITRLDDGYYLVDNIAYFLNPASFRTTFVQSAVAEQYRPILFSSLIAETLVGKGSLGIYHASNIVWHWLASVGVYVMLLRLQFSRRASLIAACLFCVHPLCVQAVAWIPGRSESMQLAMMMLAIGLFLSYLRSPSQTVLIAHFVVFALALLTKETSVLIPVFSVMAALVLAREDGVLLDQVRELWQRYRTIALGWAALGVVWIVARTAAISNYPAADREVIVNVVGLGAFVSNLPALPELCGKMVVPLNLAVYPRFSVFSTVMGLVVFPLFVVAVWLVCSASWRKQVFALVWIVLCIVPSMVIRSKGYNFEYLDYRAYTALFGFAVFVAMFAEEFERFHPRSTAVAAVIVGIFGVISWRQSGYFDGEERFWARAQQENPEMPKPYLHYGEALMKQQRLQEAENQFRTAIRLDSTYAEAYSKLAVAVYNRAAMAGFAEASALFEKARALNPKLSDPHINLLILHIQRQDVQKALQTYQQLQQAGFTLQQLRPDVAQALQTLVVQAQQAQQSQAVQPPPPQNSR